MKQIIISLTIILLCNISSYCQAQTLTDFKNTQADVSLTYDSNWNPIAKFSIKNVANKTITNVEIVIYYSGYSDSDHLQPYTTCSTSTNIAPNERKILTFYIKGHNNKKPQSFSLLRIRYADGTVCDRIR